jgi:mRNA interferase RelE/StbE
LADFAIFETEQFLKDLEQELGGRQTQLRRKLLDYVYPQLRRQPYFGKNIKKLAGFEPDTWRYRIGDYRFFYTIDAAEKLVIMLTADHRSRAY